MELALAVDYVRSEPERLSELLYTLAVTASTATELGRCGWGQLPGIIFDTVAEPALAIQMLVPSKATPCG